MNTHGHLFGRGVNPIGSPLADAFRSASELAAGAPGEGWLATCSQNGVEAGGHFEEKCGAADRDESKPMMSGETLGKTLGIAGEAGEAGHSGERAIDDPATR